MACTAISARACGKPHFLGQVFVDFVVSKETHVQGVTGLLEVPVNSQVPHSSGESFMNRPLLLVSLSLTGYVLIAPNLCQAGIIDHWTLKVGAHTVDPRSTDGALAGGAVVVDVHSATRPTFTVEAFLNDSWGLELVAAPTFKHTVSSEGATIAAIEHLPPVLSLQYHFARGATFSPYVGVGLNYTWVMDEHTEGPLAGTEIEVGNSWGAALHAGLDWQINEHWFLGLDVRWVDIDADVRLDGSDVGTVNVDPLVYGLYLGRRF